MPNANQKFITTYFRRQFTVDPATLGSVTLQLKRDDGAVVYLNGTEIVRSNMPTGTITSSTFASTNVEGAAENQFFPFTIPTSAFVNGTNTIAVEVHQHGADELGPQLRPLADLVVADRRDELRSAA